jgi:hypothetical protein
VLEIHLRNSDSPIMCSVELETLLHDVRVVQGVPFLELVTGDLVNLTEVIRITEQRELDSPAAEKTRNEPCDHGVPVGAGCVQCQAIADVEAQQLPEAMPYRDYPSEDGE